MTEHEMPAELEIHNGALFMEDERDFLVRSTEEVAGVEYSFTPIQNPLRQEMNQNEFADEFTKGMCTHYGPLGGVSTTVAQILDEAYRYDSGKVRYDAPDFDQENGGGYSAVGVNVNRKFWNERNPNRKLKTIAVKKDSPLVMDGLRAGYRAVWGYRGNSEYQKDYRKDAVLDNPVWGKPTYGHCLSMMLIDGDQVAVDNYAGRQGEGGIDTNIYKLAKWDEMVKNPNVHETVYFFVFEDTLTISQRWRLEAKKMELWSAVRENDTASRYEAALMIERAIGILKKAGIQPKGTDFWNGKQTSFVVKRSELSLMLDRSLGVPESFSWENMNDPATRGEVAEVVCRSLYQALGKKI